MPRRSHLGIAFASVIALAACAQREGVETPSASPAAANWRATATSADRERIRGWRQAWLAALDQVDSAADLNRIQAEGALLEPDAALAGAALPPGPYKCRVIKLGSRSDAGRAFTAYPAFDCRVDDQGEVQGFAKVSGSQRPVGLVFPDTGSREIFLGTLMLGDETRAIEYGQDGERDMAGLVERVGPRKWRLVLPYPRFESVLDVIELVPAAA
ncbi:DUF4893 domain-containing protein [Sphingomonas gilva]|uniref:DUF4893 domain-containing protein n=1 Tax=Sphingomonas gilva TaxID=2305907 RepID=A0A396S6Y5_9SPHN|nr:DUF4893 domain-containing protein [Sphingomonas gilva]RHW19145.1 DUF4893 domain-containing protein [Sphingomonas gilva]